MKKRNVQIALPWSPLHHRATHVCITIFQHIYQRTRFVFIHNHPHHHRHHQFHRQRWHNCPHHRHSNNWATPYRQWHKHISHRHSGIQVRFVFNASLYTKLNSYSIHIRHYVIILYKCLYIFICVGLIACDFNINNKKTKWN